MENERITLSVEYKNKYPPERIDRPDERFDQAFELMTESFEENVTEEKEWYAYGLSKTREGSLLAPYIL